MKVVDRHISQISHLTQSIHIDIELYHTLYAKNRWNHSSIATSFGHMNAFSWQAYL